MKQMAKEICEKYNTPFLDVATGIYGLPGWTCRPMDCSQQPSYPPFRNEAWWTGNRPCTQAGQVMPLALGMVPESSRPAVERALLREIAGIRPDPAGPGGQAHHHLTHQFKSSLPRIVSARTVLVIDKVMYGDLAGTDPGRILDLTKELQGQVDKGENCFTVSSLVNFKGDPAHGFVKTLTVEFHLGGKTMQKSATDPERIDLLDAVGK